VLGPYDFFAIDWGYPAPRRTSAGGRADDAGQWAARQIDEPWLRFGGEDGPAAVDPTVRPRNRHRLDQGTELGPEKPRPSLDHLVSATNVAGRDFSLLEETYKSILSHRRNWFGAVALNVGGVVESRTLGGRGTRDSRACQGQAEAGGAVLNEHAFTTPTRLSNPAIVNRFKYSGVAARSAASRRC